MPPHAKTSKTPHLTSKHSLPKVGLQGMDETTERSPESRGTGLLIPGAIVIAGVIIAAAVLWAGGFGSARKGGNVAGNGNGTGTSVNIEVLADDDPALGDPNAPVTIVEFGDFQCPFCNRFFREAEREIIDTYVRTGKVRFVYRDFAFLGQESVQASEASECADEQGKFWAYHDRVYNFIWDNYYVKNLNGENVGAFSEANLKRLASDTGLDEGKFSECLASRRYKAEVEKDTADGRAAGASGTPTTFVNGKMIVGAVPFSQFEAAIEEALKK